MSTRSLISKKIVNGTYISIYCHFDGYPEHNAVILEKYYFKNEKINELIKRGNIMALHPDINGIETIFENDNLNGKAKKSYNLKKLIEQAREVNAEYLYIFANNKKWYFLEL